MILIGRGLDYSLGEAKRPRKETEAEEARKPGVVAETKEINEKATNKGQTKDLRSKDCAVVRVRSKSERPAAT